jgi:lipopolysaccharide assembly protein B
LDFDLQWLLLALPITFGLGWLASRWDWHQMQRDEKRSPRAYFKGLTHLLNEEPDQAIDAFIEVVQNDPDTADLHFALGSLFRKRGEFERAVRVHQHLLQRADLKAADRERAQLALAQDYMRAGLFDRAEAAFTPLLSGTHAIEAQQALLQLHERARNWPQATQAALALNAAQPGAYSARIAQHRCEQAEEQAAAGNISQAQHSLAQAQAAAPDSLRAKVLAAQWSAQAGQHALAWQQWRQLAEQHPQTVGLLAADLAPSIRAAGQQAAAQAVLAKVYAKTSSLDVLDAWALLDDDAAAVHTRYQTHLKLHPGVAAAAAVARTAPANAQDASLVQALQGAAKTLRRYRCAACGFESQRHFWQCPGCLTWESFPPLRPEGD